MTPRESTKTDDFDGLVKRLVVLAFVIGQKEFSRIINKVRQEIKRGTMSQVVKKYLDEEKKK